MLYMRLSLLLLLVGTASCAPSSTKFYAASFVPPASPPITTSSPAPSLAVKARHQAVARGYGTTTALWAKKTASKKIQVKMLKHVAGTGQQGDVVMVTPAFFQNKLRPTKSAVPISDEEVEAEASNKRAKEQAQTAAATSLQKKLDDVQLTIQRKAGPEGHLFGAVNSKVILEELKGKVNDDYLDQKQVKVVSVANADGKKLRGDVKDVGDYSVSISLTKDIKAKFSLSVQPES